MLKSEFKQKTASSNLLFTLEKYHNIKFHIYQIKIYEAIINILSLGVTLEWEIYSLKSFVNEIANLNLRYWCFRDVCQ